MLEATCKEHPSTVLGGMLSGLRASGQIDDYFDSKKREEEDTAIITRERAKIEYRKLFKLILMKFNLPEDILVIFFFFVLKFLGGID